MNRKIFSRWIFRVSLRMLAWCTFAVLAGMLPGCVKQGAMEGTLRAAKGGKNYGGIYRANEVGELSSLDPAQINDVTSAHVAENIYDNLMSFDEQLRLQPVLATSWEVDSLGLEYTYHLRNDVYFHDNECFPGGVGRKFTAADVKYSFTRICDARAKSKNTSYFCKKVVGAEEYYQASTKAISKTDPIAVKDIPGFVVIDDTTFRIRLVTPFAPFEQYVAMGSMGIVAREAIEKYADNYTQHAVGTGPFKFVRWLPDREVKLVRNPKYWNTDEHGNRLPFLDGVRFTFMKDEKMQLLEFAACNLEESYRIPFEFFSDVVDENKNPKGKYSKYKLFHVPAASTQYYGFLVTNPIFKDKRVRQAISMAIDRDRIIKYVLRGQAASAAIHGLVPPVVPDYQCDSIRGYSYDIDRAKKLLADAGYPNGQGFPEIQLQLNAGGGRNIAIAETIQAMLHEGLNIKMGLSQVEFAQHLDGIEYGRAPFYRLGWVADYPDPESFLNLYYGKIVPKDPAEMSSINSCRYVNPVFDSLLDKAIATPNRLERLKLYQQAEQIAVTDVPLLLIIHDEDYRFVQPYVRDYRNNSMDRRPYKYIWFDKN